MSKSVKNLFDDLSQDVLDIDPINFVEHNLTIKGKPYHLRDCGRDYLFEIYRYIAFQAPLETGLSTVVVKGRQVEMSTTATALSLYFMCGSSYTHLIGLHAFPILEQAQKYSNKSFDGLVQDSVNGVLVKKRAIDHKSKKIQNSVITAIYNVRQKDFVHGNTLYIEGASQEGDRLRGMPADFILYDEVQDWFKQAIDTVQESVSHSVLGPPGYGLEMMFGTPKNKKDEFFEIWQDSDQRVYHLKCIYCGHYFPITLENFKTGFMVECCDNTGKGCRQLQDKRLAVVGGKWVPTKSTHLRRGYHISQLLIPTITRESIAKKFETKSRRAFVNEILGEFYSGLEEALSFKDVMIHTVKEPDTKEWKFPTHITDYPTWMGIDWGGRLSGENDTGTGSYTVVLIISAMPLNKIKLEFVCRSDIADPDEQIEFISRLIRKYNVKDVCADAGYGYNEIKRLQTIWQDRVRAVYSSQNIKKVYTYNQEMNAVTIDLCRVEEEFFDALIQDKFCFPYAQPEKVEWLVEHISNIEIEIRKQGGMLRKRFLKKSVTKPIDGLMALVYAFVAYQFSKTLGFANMDAIKRPDTRYNMPRAQLAYISPTVGKLWSTQRRTMRHLKY